MEKVVELTCFSEYFVHIYYGYSIYCLLNYRPIDRGHVTGPKKQKIKVTLRTTGIRPRLGHNFSQTIQVEVNEGKKGSRKFPFYLTNLIACV